MLVQMLDVNCNTDFIVTYICNINAVKDSNDSPHH